MTMSMRLKLAISLAPLAGALAFAVPAQAAPPSGGGTPHAQSGPHGDFHHGDFHHDHDRFRHDHFGVGFGFWDPWWDWGPADYWSYYYPSYYPPYYPDYYSAPPPLPPAAGYAPTPGAPTQATGAPPPQYWYYCDSPQGYYPYVQNCGSSWRQVAATPPAGSSNTITPTSKP